MKGFLPLCFAVLLAGGTVLLADEPAVGLVDNLFLEAGAGAERQPGDESAGFTQLGANWGIPLTPPEGVALGLQLGGGLRLGEDNPEWNTTVGGFGRNLPSFPHQQGAAAMLVDYQRTPAHQDLWALRPIVGTTITPKDALGLTGVVSLNHPPQAETIDSLTTFWTRGWSDRWGTEFGAGYEFKNTDKALFRARAAMGLTRSCDLWCGGDANNFGSFAVGLGVTYHFGATGRHAVLDNIGGSGAGLFTPFPSAEFPAIMRRLTGPAQK
jgi:hypothetical protein